MTDLSPTAFFIVGLFFGLGVSGAIVLGAVYQPSGLGMLLVVAALTLIGAWMVDRMDLEVS